MREQKNERPKALKYRRLEECENGSPNKWKNQHAKAFKKKNAKEWENEGKRE